LTDKLSKKESKPDYTWAIIGVAGFCLSLMLLIAGWDMLTGGLNQTEDNYQKINLNTSKENTDNDFTNRYKSNDNIVIKKSDVVLTTLEISNLAFIKAQENNDIQYCEDSRLDYGDIQYCKFMFAQNKEDISLCSYLNISLYDLNSAAKQTYGLGDIGFLLENNVSTKDTCILLIAYETKDLIRCNKIGSDFAKQRCISAVNSYMEKNNSTVTDTYQVVASYDFNEELINIDVPKYIAKEGIYLDGQNIELKNHDIFDYTYITIEGSSKNYRFNLPLDSENTLRNYFFIINGNENNIEIKNAAYIDYLKIVGKFNYVSFDYDFAYVKLLMNRGLIINPDDNNEVDCCWK
jgi:hypothetical protein